MFFEDPSYYPFEQVNIEDTSLRDPIRIIHFRFQAKKRKYLVTVQCFSFGVHAIKYCGLKDRNKGNAYSIIYNDGDGIKVISTCLQIMLLLWKRDPNISFGFYAVPRVDPSPKKKNRKSRFNIYEKAMLNLFSPDDFRQYNDPRSMVYILLNKNVPNKRSVISQIGKYLLSEFDMIFKPYLDPKPRSGKKSDGMRFG